MLSTQLEIDNHMSNRRNFIKNLGALSLLLGASKISVNAQTPKKPASKKVNKPIVLSTWRFGIEANAEAWKVFQSVRERPPL